MAFGGTSVKAMELHWNQHQLLELTNTFDIIVASDWYLALHFSLPLFRYVFFSSLIMTHIFMIQQYIFQGIS